MNSNPNWIYTKLEYICGVLTGSYYGIVTMPPEHNYGDDIIGYLIKSVFVVVFGFLGALGAWVWKLIEKKLKEKK